MLRRPPSFTLPDTLFPYPTLFRAEREYRRRAPSSAELARRASATLPGGNTRTTVYHAPYPLTFARGDGPWLWDLDGNRYLDLFYNGLSIIHGHGYAPIREAVQEAMLAGTALGSTSSELVEFAELLQGRLPHAEQLRFTNSGRSEEHTSELQSLMRNSYAVFCLKNKQ